MSEEPQPAPDFASMAEEILTLRKAVIEKDGIIGQYQTTIDDLNKAAEEREARINKLQGIIADNLGSRQAPQGAPAAPKSFEDRYRELIESRRNQ